MNVPAFLAGNAISAAGPATELIVGPVEAWVLLLTLLALCCGMLWVVTRPAGATEATAGGSPSHGTVNRRRGTLLAPGSQRVRRPVSIVSQVSPASSPSTSGVGGATA